MSTRRHEGDWVHADRLLASLRRVVVFCGGFGTGKTEVAVNFALLLARDGRRVRLADLDIVNLYFRSREVRRYLRDMGIEVLVPEERLVNADMPVILPEVRGALEHPDGNLVLDLGGDPSGARVMASLAGLVPPEETATWLVVNSRRPESESADAVLRMLASIESASGLRITGLVVNSHLADETTPAIIEEGVRLAAAVHGAGGPGIIFVAMERRLAGEIDAGALGYPVIFLQREMLKPWETGGHPARADEH
ncbi:tyrosine-protein kinase family protein [candidate division WOR-3 bacterium]|nr:tyrosine-protein kinase family protein [candidate division WOR-3 bacterium]